MSAPAQQAWACATAHVQPPLAWSHGMHYPDGACRCCTHSQPCAEGLGCACPDVAGRGQPVPVAVARQHGGACGLEAWHHSYQRARA